MVGQLAEVAFVAYLAVMAVQFVLLGALTWICSDDNRTLRSVRWAQNHPRTRWVVGIAGAPLLWALDRMIGWKIGPGR